jgi:hypothetical protein
MSVWWRRDGEGAYRRNVVKGPIHTVDVRPTIRLVQAPWSSGRGALWHTLPTGQIIRPQFIIDKVSGDDDRLVLAWVSVDYDVIHIAPLITSTHFMLDEVTARAHREGLSALKCLHTRICPVYTHQIGWFLCTFFKYGHISLKVYIPRHCN